MTPTRLAKRINAFKRGTVLDEDYKSWCEEIGPDHDNWTIKNIDPSVMDQYKEFLFSDVRFDFKSMFEIKPGEQRFSLDDYGWMSKNPLIPIFVESEDSVIDVYIKQNAQNLFIEVLGDVVFGSNVDTYRKVFFDWKPNWNWEASGSEFLVAYDMVDEIIQEGDDYSENTDMIYVNENLISLFFNTWSELREVDHLGIIQCALSIFALCRNFEKALGSSHQRHLLSFLEEV